MGCIVNGPGESKHSNIGISLPGTFEDPKAPVFVDGRLMTTLQRRQHRGRIHRHPQRLRTITLWCRDQRQNLTRGTKNPDFRRYSQPQHLTSDLLLRRWLRAARTVSRALSRPLGHPAYIDVAAIHITHHLHGFSNVRSKPGRISIRRKNQLVCLSGSVGDRKVRSAAAETAFCNRRVWHLAGAPGLRTRLGRVLASATGRRRLLLTRVRYLRTREVACPPLPADMPPGCCATAQDQGGQHKSVAAKFFHLGKPPPKFRAARVLEKKSLPQRLTGGDQSCFVHWNMILLPRCPKCPAFRATLPESQQNHDFGGTHSPS